VPLLDLVFGLWTVVVVVEEAVAERAWSEQLRVRSRMGRWMDDGQHGRQTPACPAHGASHGG
jgi:hypothetical protein